MPCALFWLEKYWEEPHLATITTNVILPGRMREMTTILWTEEARRWPLVGDKHEEKTLLPNAKLTRGPFSLPGAASWVRQRSWEGPWGHLVSPGTGRMPGLGEGWQVPMGLGTRSPGLRSQHPRELSGSSEAPRLCHVRPCMFSFQSASDQLRALLSVGLRKHK